MCKVLHIQGSVLSSDLLRSYESFIVVFQHWLRMYVAKSQRWLWVVPVSRSYWSWRWCSWNGRKGSRPLSSSSCSGWRLSSRTWSHSTTSSSIRSQPRTQLTASVGSLSLVVRLPGRLSGCLSVRHILSPSVSLSTFYLSIKLAGCLSFYLLCSSFYIRFLSHLVWILTINRSFLLLHCIHPIIQQSGLFPRIHPFLFVRFLVLNVCLL